MIPIAYTFDDVLLEPAFSDINPDETDVSTSIADGFSLSKPLISAPMDTVTEHAMAVAMAQSGGLGIIHRNMTINEQVAEITKVKKHESWVVYDPLTTRPDASIEEVINLMRKHNYSGIPVVDPENGRLLGIVTNRDVRFAANKNSPVYDIATKEGLVTIKNSVAPSIALELMHSHRIEKLLLVDDDYKCKGLITVKDIENFHKFPDACKDEMARLKVGAAVGAGADAIKRASALIEAGADVIVIDTAHGHSKNVLDVARNLRSMYKDLVIIGGNVVTESGAEALIKAGVNCIKVGIGPGSICTTRIVAGTGMPQLSAIMNVRDICKRNGVRVIADGGIKNSGDIAKAIAAGADAVMMGRIFASAYESPGDMITYQGGSYKMYRGMGSISAMKKGSSDRYRQGNMAKMISEGVEGKVPLQGSLAEIMNQMVGGLRLSMGYTGNRTIAEMKDNCKFVRITSAGLQESHVHNITVTRETL